MSIYNIFNQENEILKKSLEILYSCEKEKSPLYHDYELLVEEYQKFLREMEVIFSISDINHKLIKETQQKLEQEIRQREGVEVELKQKIEQLSKYKQRLEGANERLLELSSQDELTSLPNRRRFEEYISEIRKHKNLSKQPLSVIMVDIDFFKKYNDLYGHIAGDKCLREVAYILAKLPRTTDFIARYGGEEFIIVLPNTGYKGVRGVAKRILHNIREATIPHQDSEIADILTVSLGTSSINKLADYTIDDIVNKADEALYQAKKAGRDQLKSISV